MADYRIMLPFVFHFAAGVYGKNGSDLLLPLEEQFEIARKTGWSDDPDDPGGATMIDVTLATYNAYRRRNGLCRAGKEDLRRMSYTEFTEILETMYWNLWRASEIESQGIANLLVDWVWASGGGSVRSAQRVIGVTPDGVVGERTLSAIDSADPELLFKALVNAREVYYRRCRGAWKYLRGWLRRLHAIRSDGTFSY